MSRWSRGEPEVGEVSPPLNPEISRELAEGLSADDQEVDALIHRMRRPASRQSPVLVPALVLALAALVLMALRPQVAVPPVVAVMDPARVVLAEGVSALILGEVDLLEDAEWVVVRLSEGAAGFTTDRPLAVLAGDVRVELSGGELHVLQVDDQVEVRVMKGSASMMGPLGHMGTIRAGERWVSPMVFAVENPPTLEVERPKRPEVREPVPEPVVVRPQPSPVVPVAVEDLAPIVRASPPRDAASALSELLDLVAEGAPSEVLQISQTGIERDFPDSPESHEAIARVAEVRASRLPARDAVRLLAEVRAAYPGLPRRLDLLELQAKIAKDGLRDCGMALPAYRELAASASGVQRAEAQAWRGICAHHEGLATEAMRALVDAKAGPLSPPMREVVEQAIERIQLLDDTP